MARSIAAVCWLMLLNTALAQEEPAALTPQEFAPNVQYFPAAPEGITTYPEYPANEGTPATLIPLTQNGIPLQPFNPNQPSFVACPQCNMPATPPPIDEELRLVTKVYGVADLVVVHDAAADPNQALLSMITQQDEELVMTVAAATAGAAGAQQHSALSELAETIESTFADEFEGRGSITLHQATKSLIVRQTENLHVEISDLLTQLRHVNDTKINVTIELFDLDEARTAFALAHHGQVLDEASVQKFREMRPEGEGEQPGMVFTITTRNGASASLPAFVLPGTLTAVASEDQSEICVLLNIAWDMDLGRGMSQQHSFQVPQEGALLTMFSDGDGGIVMLLNAEIEGSQEAEEQVSETSAGQDWQSRIVKLRNVSAEIVYEVILQQLACRGEIEMPEQEFIIVPDRVSNNLMIHASPRYFDEIVALVEQLDVAPPQIMTEVVLVEAESLLEDFLSWALDEFGGAIQCDPQSHESVAVCLEPASADQFFQALLEENVELRVHSRPQIISIDGHKSEIQVGQVVPLVDTVTFEENRVVPVVEEIFVGTVVSLVSTVAANNCIEMQIQATHREPVLESLVRPASGKPPAFNCTQATTTLTVPQTSTVVWPVRLASDEAAAGRTLLIILMAREISESPSAE